MHVRSARPGEPDVHDRGQENPGGRSRGQDQWGPGRNGAAPRLGRPVVDSRAVTTTPDLKPRSRDVTDGLERAAARGMLRAVGLGDEDFAKPQIGVASSWNEITPCNLSLQRLAQAAKDGVHGAG